MSQQQALIDDGLLIDLGADTYQHFLNMGRTLWDVEHLLVTHAHVDHFAVEDLFCRFEGFAHHTKVPKLKVYLTEVAYQYVLKCFRARGDDEDGLVDSFDFVIIRPFSTISVGEYTVTVLPARHASPGEAVVFVIEKDGKSVFYGNDTGVFGEEVDDFLSKQGVKINLLSLDCTKGDNEFDYYTHMSMAEGREIADRFRDRGILADDATLYYTHFSHNGGMIYDDLRKVAREKYGFDVAYDGLEIEI